MLTMARSLTNMYLRLARAMQPTPAEPQAPAEPMHISDQFAAARQEAERRGWTVESLSFDSQGLHMSVTIKDGHVKWFASMYERLAQRLGPR